MVFLQTITKVLQLPLWLDLTILGTLGTVIFRNIHASITNKFSKQRIDERVDYYDKKIIECENSNKEQGESLITAIQLWGEEVKDLKLSYQVLSLNIKVQTEKIERVLSKVDSIDAMIEDMGLFASDIIEMFGEEDKHVKELINVFLGVLVQFYQSVLSSNLYKITPKLLIPMYEAHAKPVRDYYNMLEPDFVAMFVPEAREHGKLYLQAVVNMIESKANTRKDSFKVQTLAFFRNQIYLVLNKRNEWKGKQSNK